LLLINLINVIVTTVDIMVTTMALKAKQAKGQLFEL
jgi:hypothetical protein